MEITPVARHRGNRVYTISVIPSDHTPGVDISYKVGYKTRCLRPNPYRPTSPTSSTHNPTPTVKALRTENQVSSFTFAQTLLPADFSWNSKSRSWEGPRDQPSLATSTSQPRLQWNPAPPAAAGCLTAARQLPFEVNQSGAVPSRFSCLPAVVITGHTSKHFFGGKQTNRKTSSYGHSPCFLFDQISGRGSGCKLEAKALPEVPQKLTAFTILYEAKPVLGFMYRSIQKYGPSPCRSVGR